MTKPLHILTLVLLVECGLARCCVAETSPPAEEHNVAAVDIGTRVEMLVDDWLIDPSLSQGVELRLQTPVRREVVLTTDQPWEGNVSGYYSIFKDGSKYRLYYRGSSAKRDDSAQQVTCYAESDDGIHFVRPKLHLHAINGSDDNNVIMTGAAAHNFAPFLDSNPDAKPEELYKALSGLTNHLTAYASADGIHWNKMQKEPVLTKGSFDSLNLAFWDEAAHTYRAYSRYMAGKIRSIQHSESPDFLHWTTPEPNEFSESSPPTHFYTNGTLQCPGAPHHYLAFPMRFEPDRQKLSDAPEKGISDAVFLTSRDGKKWDRTFLEAWLRAGPDPHNWTDRSNMPAWGIVQTAPDEFSMYVSEHYRWPDNRLRRVTIRRHGFAAVHAGANGGEFTTRPILFSGKQLVLNYATSAAGSLQVEIQDATGAVLPGYGLSDMLPLYGDELDRAVVWKSKSDVAELVGKPVRFRFVLKDADLFAIRTRNPDQSHESP